MDRPLTFSLPGGFRFTEAIKEIKERLARSHPHVRIQTYDTVHGLSWNGGRLTFGRELVRDRSVGRYSEFGVDDLDGAVARVRELNAAGIPFQLTFNNTLEGIDVEDDLGNHLLANLEKTPEGVRNGVTVATRGLARHVRERYPGFALTASICFGWRDPEDLAAAFPAFDRVVLLPWFAYCPEVLATLSLEKAVFILNDKCYLFCPRKEHYAYVSRCNLAGNLTREEQERNRAGERCYTDHSEAYRRSWRSEEEHQSYLAIHRRREEQLRTEGIADELKARFAFNITRSARRDLFRMGVRDFKLQGRELTEARYREDVLGFFEAMLQEDFTGEEAPA
jgi:hypothetical protein